jgi:hypothetical protein
MPDSWIEEGDHLPFGVKYLRWVRYYDFRRLLTVDHYWWIVVAVVATGTVGGGVAAYDATHGVFDKKPQQIAVLASPSPTASALESPTPLQSPVGKPEPSPTIFPSPRPGQTGRLTLSGVAMGVRRCSPACPNKAAALVRDLQVHEREGLSVAFGHACQPAGGIERGRYSNRGARLRRQQGIRSQSAG